jgi:hypothetical protein
MTELKSTFWDRINWPWIAGGVWAVVFVVVIVTMFVPVKRRREPAAQTQRTTAGAAVSQTPASVYPDFTSAAEHWMERQPLYVRGGTNEFRYSPLIATFFVPFDLLPPKLGEVLWRAINFAAFLGTLWLCCRWWVPYRLTANQTAAVFLLAIPLAVGSLNNAQSNPLVLGLMLLATAAITRRWFTVTAIAIAIATCFKLYPVALGMLLMLRFPWRLGWRLAVCLIAAAVIPFVLQKPDYVMNQYTDWLHYLVSEDRQRGPIGDWYRDLRAVSRIYIHSMPLTTYQLIEVAAGAGIALICLLGLARHWTLRAWAGTALGLGCCWMTVIGPATESATYILLAPTLAWGVVWSQSRGRVWRIAYAVTFLLFLTAQLALNLPNGKFFRDHLQPLPIAGTLLMVLLLVDAAGRLLPARPALGAVRKN